MARYNKIRLGDCLVQKGMITEEQLSEALVKQKENGTKLGETIVELGYVSENDMIDVLVEQLGIEYVDVRKIKVDENAARLLKEDFMRKNGLIPIAFDELLPNVIRVAMADPMDIIAIDDISIITNMQVDPVLSTKGQINMAIDKIFGATQAMQAAEQYRKERERDRERDSYRDRRDYDDLQQQIRDLKNQQNNNGPMGYPYPYPPYAPYPYPYPYPQQQQPQQNIDVDALIEKLSKKQKEQVDSAMDEMKAQNQSLQDRLDAERKEREELEAMLRDIQTKGEEEEADEAEQEREQEEADKALTLDVDALPVDDDNDTDGDADNDADDDTNSENEEPVEKSELTLEQIEALVKNYQDRFQEDWMSHAKEELQGDELVKGLRFYKLQNAERKTFVDKVKKLSPEVKQIYNIVKNEFMKYNGVTNKLTNSCDVLYKGRNQIAKINFTKSRVRLYLGLDPNNAEYAKIPHKDLSNKRAHARTPFYMLLKSPLSVKRAKKLIADLMVMHNCEENLNYKPIDYATKYKFFKKDQKK